jgi:hypothetical protein
MSLIQSYNRGIRQLMIALTPAGPGYVVKGARQANLSWVIDSDKARGDDVDLDRYSKVVSVQLTIAQAALDLVVANMVLGGSLGQLAGQYYDLLIDGVNDPPYVAIAGRIAGSSGGGDLCFLIPKAKLSSTPQYNAQVDTYIFPQMQFEGVYDTSITGIVRMRHFIGTAALSIPLPTAGS